jgi:RNA polymerase sigma-70 factor (ECF subfamily)
MKRHRLAAERPLFRLVAGTPAPQSDVDADADTVREMEEGDGAVIDGARVTLALGGDRGALEALFRTHQRRVHRRVCRLMGPHPEVDDIVQDCFLTAFESLAKLSEPCAFSAWLLRIAVHKVHRRLRRERMLRRLGFVPAGDVLAATNAAVSPMLSPAQSAEARAIYALLDRLPTDARVAFVLRHLEGLTVPEVAHQTGLSERTVKRRVAMVEQAVAGIVELDSKVALS